MENKPTKEHVTLNIDSALMKEMRAFCQRDKRTLSSAFEKAAEDYLRNSVKEKK